MQIIYYWVGSTTPQSFKFPTLGRREIWPSQFTTLTIEKAYQWGVIVLAKRANFDPWAVSPFHSKGSGKKSGISSPTHLPTLRLGAKHPKCKIGVAPRAISQTPLGSLTRDNKLPVYKTWGYLHAKSQLFQLSNL